MKLLCPICKNELIKYDKYYSCNNTHSFDISKHGYVNLLINRSNTGDNKEMIKARSSFLNSDSYLPLKDKLNKLIESFNSETLLDLACGEGYYTKSFNIKFKHGVDLSKFAIEYACKNDKSSTYIISSIYDLPYDDNCFDIVTTIFAPISNNEIARVLKDKGIFILVTPGENHLFELKEILYENPYINLENDYELNSLTLTKKLKLEYKFELDNKDLIKSLFMMTPYYYKTNKKDASKLDEINSLNITASFIISLFVKD